MKEQFFQAEESVLEIVFNLGFLGVGVVMITAPHWLPTVIGLVMALLMTLCFIGAVAEAYEKKIPTRIWLWAIFSFVGIGVAGGALAYGILLLVVKG